MPWLLPAPPARVVRGTALLDGVDLLRLGPKALRRVRGRDIGMVFQDPLTSLHPPLRIGDQIAEAIRLHDADVSRTGARARADEPTTALDVTIQAQVLEVLRDVQRETGTAIIVVTHDLGVIAELPDTVTIVHRGRVVETGPVGDVFASPRLPHTAGLLARRQGPGRVAPARSAASADAVLEVSDLVKYFANRAGGRRSVVRAVDGVSFDLHPGESLGLVGESGCGKSTLARSVVRLLVPTSGRIRFEGRDISAVGGNDLRSIHARLRIVFQDTYASLNPRRVVGDVVAEPLRIHGRYRSGGAARVRQLFELVGLDPALASRSPNELSGGQRQRIGIARALALEPRVLVLDEPVSSLDVPIQAQILDLLERLQHELGLAYLLVSHDLTVVRRLCHRVAVMYLGRIVELGATASLFERPAHPYTTALLSAVPITSPAERGAGRRIVLAGDPPDPAAPPSGCRFHTRCWTAVERCVVDDPAMRAVDGQRECACHLVTPDGSPVYVASGRPGCTAG